MDDRSNGRKLNKKIAVICSGWSTEYVELVLEGIRRKASNDGVDIFVFTSYILYRDAKARKKEQLKLFDLIHPEDYDGAILLSNTFNIKEERDCAINLFKKSNTPIISTEVKLPGIPYIGSQNYSGMYELATHLIEEHNVKSIVFMKGIVGNPESAERMRAVTDALKEHGLELTDSIQGDFGFYGASLSMDEWLKKGSPLPDAFVCANDLMALGSIDTLHKHGIEVPRDVLVTGFDHSHESQLSYPMVATVSRQWDIMGEHVYEALMEQISDPDPSYHKEYESHFVPTESCGCPANETTLSIRLDKVRNIYPETVRADMVDLFFQTVRLEMDSLESKEDFYRSAAENFGANDFFGPDYCFCINRRFFELDNEDYLSGSNYVDDEVDVLYEKKNGKSNPQQVIKTRDLYPGYKKEEGKSDLYVICLLNSLDYFIGYVAIKNSTEELYNLKLKQLVNNLNLILITIKRYIFSQKNYRKLQEIYMTDFLTGMYNRTGCEKLLFSFIEEEKAAGRSTVLLFVDINNMKDINDDYGHLNGDLAIKATANAMHDSLPKGWLLGRYGGDEYVAVGKYEDFMTIEKYREHFDSILKDTVAGLHVAFDLSASAGYCLIRPDDEGNIEDYIRIADESMYEEKQKAHMKKP